MGIIIQNLERFDIYDCEIDIRFNLLDRPVKQTCEFLNNLSVTLECMWKMNSDENYTGEFAMGPYDKLTKELFKKANITWIASGDIKIIRRTSRNNK